MKNTNMKNDKNTDKTWSELMPPNPFTKVVEEDQSTKFDFGRAYTSEEKKVITAQLDDYNSTCFNWILPHFRLYESVSFENKFPHFWNEVLFAKGITDKEVIVPEVFVDWDEEYADVTLSDVFAIKGQIESKYDFTTFYMMPTRFSPKSYGEYEKKEDKKLEYYQKVYAFVKRNPDFRDLHKIDLYFAIFRNIR